MLLPNKKSKSFKLVLNVGPKAGWDYHLKRAVAWVQRHGGLCTDSMQMAEATSELASLIHSDSRKS
jgi:hypothetical protein